MSLKMRVLGGPFEDNSVFLRVEAGSSMRRLLIDCGQGCAEALDNSDVMQLDGIAFTHFHMDHVAGFDALFRKLFTRADPPVQVWGPEGTIEVMRHRFGGFTWNLTEGLEGRWQVHELRGEELESVEFRASEGFARVHPLRRRPFGGTLVGWEEGRLEARSLDHNIPVLGYKFIERDKRSVRSEALEEMGLKPGPWLGVLTSEEPFYHPHASELLTMDGWLDVGGERMLLPLLRRRLLSHEPGASLAVLTDFHVDPEGEEELAKWLNGVRTLLCESHYAEEEGELAERYGHMHPAAAGSLAARAGVEKLILFHVSARYKKQGIGHLLRQAQEWFPGAGWPRSWQRMLGEGGASPEAPSAPSERGGAEDDASQPPQSER